MVVPLPSLSYDTISGNLRLQKCAIQWSSIDSYQSFWFIGVGSGLSEKGLKSQNIQLRTNKALDPLFAKVFGYYIYS